MKHLNFLSKRQSCSHNIVTLASNVGSQEEFYVSGGNSRGAFTPADVCQTSSVRLNRFTVHRWGTMLKLISVLVLILTIGVGNVWGEEKNWNFSSDNLSSKTPISLTYGQGNASNNTTISSGTLRLYANRTGGNGSWIKFTAASGYEITAVSVTGGTNQTVARYGVDAANEGAAVSSSFSFSNNVATVSSLHASTFTIKNGQNSGSNNKTIQLASITITYASTASCDKKVTITQGTPETGGSFNLDKTGAQDCCDALTVTVSSIVAPSGKKFSAITQSGIASGVTIDQSAKTVTYAANTTGSSTINVTYEDKGCTDHGASSITSGASSGDDYGPIHAYYEYSTSQILYTKSDLDLAAGRKGTIKSIYFEYSGATAMAARTIKIYMANTDLSSLTTSNYVPYASFTQVYSGTFSCGSAGWYEITLDTPFEYNGTGNLAVMIDDNSNSYQDDKNFKYHSATGKQIYKRQDDTDIDPASWTPASAIDYRPNTKFCIEEADMTPATVTLMDNGATITEVSAGTGVTLPLREGCTGYEFVGWTKTWVSAQTEWTTIAPTIIPAGSYTPAADENLYPVYTKTEGGSGASVGTTMWAEDFSGYAKDDYPDGSTSNSHTGTTVYNNGSVTYTVAAGSDSRPKIFDDSGSGTDGNNMLIYKKNGYYTIEGISVGGASTLTLSFTKGGSGVLAVSGSDNITVSGSTSGSTITVNSGTTFDLKFQNTNNSNNLRLDDISVVIATTSNGSTTSYISVPNCCTPLGQINGSFF